MPVFKDLTGKRFGRWTVLEKAENRGKRIYWKCKCDCGTIKDVCGSFLTTGRSKSCGCINKEVLKERAGDNIKDITGNRYGKLVVIEKTNERYANGSVKWKCQCDCGKIYYSCSSELKRGRKSCGCETKLIDLTGQKFGRLLVIGKTETKNKITYWHCVCECGKEKDVSSMALRDGRVVSCGCFSAERIGNLSRTHGKSDTRLYDIWSGIKQRCYNSNRKSYSDYGKRGILMCDEWKNDFMIFYKWALENGYTENMSIDRIDVNGNYEPSNCRWVTDEEQRLNKRNTIYVEVFGEKKTLFSLCQLLGIDYKKAHSRYKRNKNIFSDEEMKVIEQKIKNGGI